ncbi:hypothetical protein BKA66DRAFT_446928 [Pyrenochaeta sp. MPI-SDFR-AT-0127]|nr:hypothetical protein BKA66DRAFT_446928 [Pyrenochaeta sp. MPI-SDFR-AT-0127]
MATLLDLPLKMFQEGFYRVVSDAGVRQAWKLRGVCRTFASEISNNIITRQPTAVLRQIENCMIVKIISTRYLAHRIVNPKDVDAKFRSLISRMADYLSQALDCPRWKFLEQLCEGLLRCWRPYHIFNLLWSTFDPSHHPLQMQFFLEEPEELSFTHKIVAAIAVRAYGLINELMHWFSTKESNHGCCIPILLSVRTSDSQLFDLTLKYLRTLVKSNIAVGLAVVDVDCPISTILSTRSLKGLQRLVAFYTECNISPAQENYKHWVDVASNLPADYLKTIFLLSPRTGVKVEKANFVEACRRDDIELIQQFFKHGDIPISDNSGQRNALILTAKYSTDIVVVRAVIDAGADINAQIPADDPRYGIMTAILVASERGWPKMVEYLLGRGAELPAPARWPLHQKTCNVLRQARINAGMGDVPVFPVFSLMSEAERERL